MKIAVISVTNQGDLIGRELKEYFNIDLYLRSEVKEKGLRKITEKAFNNYKAVIFISSTGIAVRGIAPFIKSKVVDPAVLVIDSSGKFVISLISGHLGGANEFTLRVADIINAVPVITTATDNMGVAAPDIIARDNNLIIDNLKICKEIASLLVEGKKILFLDDRNVISLPKGYSIVVNNEKENQNLDDMVSSNLDIYHTKEKMSKGIVWVTNKQIHTGEIINIIDERIEETDKFPVLKLIRKDVVLGIGCRKDYSNDAMKETVLEKLKEYNIDKRAIKAIATVEVKKNEKAIIELAEYLDCELKIFTLDEIKKVQHHFDGSDFVEKIIGVRAVCEPCVELLGARLITDKMKCNGMTLCIGEEN